MVYAGEFEFAACQRIYLKLNCEYTLLETRHTKGHKT